MSNGITELEISDIYANWKFILTKKKYPFDVNINKNISLQIQSISTNDILVLFDNIFSPIIFTIFFLLNL